MNVQLFYIRELSWFQWTLKIHLAVSRFTLTSYCLCLGINAGIKSVIDCILLGKPKVLQQASREHDTLCWMMSIILPFLCVFSSANAHEVAWDASNRNAFRSYMQKQQTHPLMCLSGCSLHGCRGKMDRKSPKSVGNQAEGLQCCQDTEKLSVLDQGITR